MAYKGEHWKEDYGDLNKSKFIFQQYPTYKKLMFQINIQEVKNESR